MIENRQGLFKAIFLEEGDYNRPPQHFKGERAEAILIPESEIDKYSEEVLRQLDSAICSGGHYFGQIYTYKPIKKAGAD